MELQINSIKFINFFIVITFFIMTSACEDKIEPTYECVDCIEYSYLQSYGDTSILLTLSNNIYCIGDSAWATPNNNFWTKIDEDLLTLMSESSYCQAIEDSIN
jgi:hypothetical protein